MCLHEPVGLLVLEWNPALPKTRAPGSPLSWSSAPTREPCAPWVTSCCKAQASNWKVEHWAGGCHHLWMWSSSWNAKGAPQEPNRAAQGTRSASSPEQEEASPAGCLPVIQMENPEGLPPGEAKQPPRYCCKWYLRCVKLQVIDGDEIVHTGK